jgi:hypothetical protein
MSPPRWHLPSPALARLSAIAAIAASLVSSSVAHADDAARRIVDTQAILTGVRWYFGETPRGHLTSVRGDAVTVVLGRDVFTADGTSALALEAHVSAAIGGGGGRLGRAGVSLGVKARTRSRVEVAFALVVADHFDPDHLRDVRVAPGAMAQLSFDLDGAPPYSTRVLLRTELHQPSERIATLDAFVGIGTRWP